MPICITDTQQFPSLMLSSFDIEWSSFYHQAGRYMSPGASTRCGERDKKRVMSWQAPHKGLTAI